MEGEPTLFLDLMGSFVGEMWRSYLMISLFSTRTPNKKCKSWEGMDTAMADCRVKCNIVRLSIEMCHDVFVLRKRALPR